MIEEYSLRPKSAKKVKSHSYNIIRKWHNRAALYMRIALLRGCSAAIPRNIKKITKKVSAEDDGKVLLFPLPIIPAACIVFFFSPQPPYDTKSPLWRRTEEEHAAGVRFNKNHISSLYNQSLMKIWDNNFVILSNFIPLKHKIWYRWISNTNWYLNLY